MSFLCEVELLKFVISTRLKLALNVRLGNSNFHLRYKPRHMRVQAVNCRGPCKMLRNANLYRIIVKHVNGNTLKSTP